MALKCYTYKVDFKPDLLQALTLIYFLIGE